MPKHLGILGGMGPAASAAFLNRVIQHCQSMYGAIQDTDYPKVTLHSIPLKEFDETGVRSHKAVVEQLLQGVDLLVKSDCDVIVIPCNTVHLFIDELRAASPIPILSIVEATIEAAKEFDNVILFASESALNEGLYQSALKKAGIGHLLPPPSAYPLITKAIHGVMGGTVDAELTGPLLSIVENMKGDALLLGCTELPLAIEQEKVKVPVIDSLSVLAKSAVDYVYKDGPAGCPR